WMNGRVFDWRDDKSRGMICFSIVRASNFRLFLGEAAGAPSASTPTKPRSKASRPQFPQSSANSANPLMLAMLPPIRLRRRPDDDPTNTCPVRLPDALPLNPRFLLQGRGARLHADSRAD